LNTITCVVLTAIQLILVSYGNSCKDGRWMQLAHIGFSDKHSGSTIRESLLMRNLEVEVMTYFTVIFSAIDRTSVLVSQDVISFKAHF
jgi:ABC-type iron transport system FetAB permease component